MAELGLAETIEALRDELESAMARSDGRQLQFVVGPVQVEFHVGVRREAGGSAKARFWVLEAGTEGTYARETIQKVSLTLELQTADGSPVLVERGLEAAAMREDRRPRCASLHVRGSRMLIVVTGLTGPPGRFGSGYLCVGAGLVLTASHAVRRRGCRERCAVRDAEEYAGAAAPGDRRPSCRPRPIQVEGGPVFAGPLDFGTVSRSVPGRIENARAVGFPRFKEVRACMGCRIRDSVQVDGHLPTAEGLVSGYLTLRSGAAPRAAKEGESAWAGMSGAAVFAGDVLVGVVSEHHLAEGEASLTIAPWERLALAGADVEERFWTILGVPASAIVLLEPPAQDGGGQRPRPPWRCRRC